MPKKTRLSQSLEEINYHFFWDVSRQQPLLADEIKQETKRLIHQVAEDKGWLIVSLRIRPASVQVQVAVSSTVSPMMVLTQIKGRVGGELRRRYPVFQKLPSTWSGGCIITTHELSAALIADFRALQQD